MTDNQNELYARAHRLLHILWTKAVGTATYNKKEWNEFDVVISRLARKG